MSEELYCVCAAVEEALLTEMNLELRIRLFRNGDLFVVF